MREETPGQISFEPPRFRGRQKNSALALQNRPKLEFPAFITLFNLKMLQIAALPSSNFEGRSMLHAGVSIHKKRPGACKQHIPGQAIKFENNTPVKFRAINAEIPFSHKLKPACIRPCQSSAEWPNANQPPVWPCLRQQAESCAQPAPPWE